MCPRLLYVAVAAFLFVFTTSSSQADPVTLALGGPAVTTNITALNNKEGSASVTMQYNADGKSLTITVTNTSSNPNLAISYFGFSSPEINPFSGNSSSTTTLVSGNASVNGINWGSPFDDITPIAFAAPNFPFRALPADPAKLVQVGQTLSVTVTFQFRDGRAVPATVQINPAVQVLDLKTLPGAEVPEPGTLLLIGTGLSIVAAKFRNRRRN